MIIKNLDMIVELFQKDPEEGGEAAASLVSLIADSFKTTTIMALEIVRHMREDKLAIKDADRLDSVADDLANGGNGLNEIDGIDELEITTGLADDICEMSDKMYELARELRDRGHAKSYKDTSTPVIRSNLIMAAFHFSEKIKFGAPPKIPHKRPPSKRKVA